MGTIVKKLEQHFRLKDGEIKQYMFVISELTGREVKRRYARSNLGIIWSVLNPLMNMVIMSLIFSTMFQNDIDNYPIYYLTGSMIWSLFREATESSISVLVDNRDLLIRSKLPKQVFVLSRVYTATVNFGYSLLAFFPMVLLFGIMPKITWLFLPVVIIFALLFAVGVSYMLSICYVFFGDIRHLYSVFMTILMFMSAIFYPAEQLSMWMQQLLAFNPIFVIITVARKCILYGEMPTMWQWIRMMICGVGVFGLGLYVFRKYENNVMQKV